MGNDVAALIAAGGAAYLVVEWVRRVAQRAEARKACSHDLYLDDGNFPTYRCRKCTHQEPARDIVAERLQARQDRVQELAIQRCPRCGGDLG